MAGVDVLEELELCAIIPELINNAKRDADNFINKQLIRISNLRPNFEYFGCGWGLILGVMAEGRKFRKFAPLF